MSPDGQHYTAPILLVDDRPENLIVLEGLLEGQGYELVKALSGKEALGMTLRHDFALILMDVRMPGMDGFETAELLRSHPKTWSIPIIFVTAGVEDLHLQFKGYHVGAVDYLTKPLEPLFLQSKCRIFSELHGQRLKIERQKQELEAKNLELRQANSKLKELDRLKSMFIASMSHELRTPLNSIIGFSSIVLDEWLGALNPQQREKLAIVLRTGKHLLSLIDDVIDVSKIESGGIATVVEEFALNEVIDEAVALFAHEIADKGLTLQVVSMPLAMRTDRRRLMQCVVNLLSNAVKFSDTGTITINTAVAPGTDLTADDARLTITVSDTGIGIHEQEMGKLFTPFGRIAVHRQITTPGTGLGLYLVKKISREILRGQVSAQSRIGEGSTFTLSIPVRL
jgi:signal transduction histidine kinase